MIVPVVNTVEEADKWIKKVKHELDYGGYLTPYDKVRSSTWAVYQNLLRRKEELKKEACNHEFVFREYLGQPYGTCASCGQTIIGK